MAVSNTVVGKVSVMTCVLPLDLGGSIAGPQGSTYIVAVSVIVTSVSVAAPQVSDRAYHATQL